LCNWVEGGGGLLIYSDSASSVQAINGLTLEGEGVSPIAVGPNDSAVEVLIPCDRRVNKTQNISISNPRYAAMVLKPVRAGHIAVMFDRQPMWNNGPGSDIGERDNLAILRGIINYLAPRLSNAPPTNKGM
jgi:hypothetical protein